MPLIHCVLCWARLGNLRGFDSLYRIRTGLGLLMIHSLFHCYRPRLDSWPVVDSLGGATPPAGHCSL
nr:MAG TPA: hypothetical protein [Caudoviricetes sp.]